MDDKHMKTVNDLNGRKAHIVRIDPALDRFKGKALFPEKLARANEMLKTAKLLPRGFRRVFKEDIVGVDAVIVFGYRRPEHIFVNNSEIVF